MSLLSTVESVWSDKLNYMGTVTMAFTGQSKNVHILAGILSLDNKYQTGKTPLLASNMLVNCRDILPETSKGSACWDLGGNSHLTWL